jgi:hypothetical protein
MIFFLQFFDNNELKNSYIIYRTIYPVNPVILSKKYITVAYDTDHK